LNKNIIVENYV